MKDETVYILIVEDNDSHVELIRRAFTPNPLLETRLSVAHTLGEAQAVLAESQPNLVIADLVLPDGQGMDLLPSHREDFTFPFVIMTSYGNEQAAVEAMKAGAMDYIVKSQSAFQDMPRIAARALREWDHIIERKAAEQQIRIHEEQLRSLASELSLIEERQRRDIATSLHDNVGQILALSKMKLGSLQQQATAKEIHESLHEIADMIEKTITYTRDLTFQLSPPILYDVGLEAALQWLLDEIEKHNYIQTSFEDDGQIKSLDDNVRVFLFQSVRELLFNITKHAQARRAKIRIERVDADIHIAVTDNGIGFDIEQLTQSDRQVSGFGLFNIRERLDHLGGQFQIHSQIGKGTTITLIAPLQV